MVVMKKRAYTDAQYKRYCEPGGVADDIAYWTAEEDIESAKTFFKSILCPIRDYEITWNWGVSLIFVEPDDFVYWGVFYPEDRPEGESDGFWIGEGCLYMWQQRRGELLELANSLKEAHEAGEPIQDFADAIAVAWKRIAQDIADEIAKDIQEDCEYIYTREAFEDYAEANDLPEEDEWDVEASRKRSIAGRAYYEKKHDGLYWYDWDYRYPDWIQRDRTDGVRDYLREYPNDCLGTACYLPFASSNECFHWQVWCVRHDIADGYEATLEEALDAADAAYRQYAYKEYGSVVGSKRKAIKKRAYLNQLTWSGVEYYQGGAVLEYDEPHKSWVWWNEPWVLNWAAGMPLIAINEETGERKNLTDLLMGGKVEDSLFYINDAPFMNTDSWTQRKMISEASRKTALIDNTFFQDFSIADMFGKSAIQDTFNRAFREWKSDYEYLTALVVALNHKIWQHYEAGNEDLARLYNDFWEQADAYACDNLKGEELQYFYRETD